MNNLKRFLSVAVMLSILLCAFGAFAADTSFDTTKSVWADAENGVTEIKMQVKFVNETGEEGDNYLPKTVFEYSLSALDTDIPATDTAPTIHAGPEGGVAFTNDGNTTVWTKDYVKTTTDQVSITLDPSKFPEPGVYRYYITQADMTAAQNDLGIVPDAQAKKVFDVFVGMKDQEKIVTATVLANMEEKAQPVLDNDTNTATYENKVIGYENKIKTYKVTLTKTVTGDAGDMTYKFPFKVKLSSDVTEDDKTTIDGFPVVLATADSTKATVGTTESTIGAVLSDIAIAHGGSVTIDSLPKSAVVSLMETIAAGEGYTITSTVAGTDEGVKNITGTSTHSESGDTYATEGEIKDADISLNYTNNRENISPTGVITRYLPFVLVLAGAVVLMATSRKRSKAAA